MPDTIKDGGPAFPVHPNANPAGDAAGMSLRDWFAGQALAGVLANPSDVRDESPFAEACGHYASVAYAYADAMLAAREAR